MFLFVFFSMGVERYIKYNTWNMKRFELKDYFMHSLILTNFKRTKLERNVITL